MNLPAEASLKYAQAYPLTSMNHILRSPIAGVSPTASMPKKTKKMTSLISLYSHGQCKNIIKIKKKIEARRHRINWRERKRKFCKQSKTKQETTTVTQTFFSFEELWILIHDLVPLWKSVSLHLGRMPFRLELKSIDFNWNFELLHNNNKMRMFANRKSDVK